MTKIHRITPLLEPVRGHDSQQVPMRAIRLFARQVAERFRPDKIILFGSYAYGRPEPDSDVDILVVTSTRNQHDQAVKIRLAVPAPFPMDLLVRSPRELQWRLQEGDSFVREIMSKGKVLYEASAGGGSQTLGDATTPDAGAETALSRRGQRAGQPGTSFHRGKPREVLGPRNSPRKSPAATLLATFLSPDRFRRPGDCWFAFG